VGVLDCHTHILPCIDDGAKSLDDGVALCRRLAELGVTEIVATPHWCSPRFTVIDQGIMAAWQELQATVARTVPSLKLLLGCEHHLSGLQSPDAFVASMRPLGGGRCVLIELPDDHLPPSTWNVLFAVLRAGLRPILAHPERCKGLSIGDEGLRTYIDSGGLLQVTLGHVLGAHGIIMRFKSRRLLKHFPRHCLLASDSHDLAARRPRWDQLPEKWRHLVPENAAALEAWSERPLG
jgi:protein-tyrosine phosphatase